MSETSDNPYQPPESDITPAGSEAESIRLSHISHEAKIKSIGFLYYISAFLLIATGYIYVLQFFSSEPVQVGLVEAVLPLMLGIFQFWVAIQLRRLKPSARIPAVIVSIFGLMLFPLGTLISAYILYVLLCKKGRFILSVEYAEIVRATPDIKHQTSLLIWLLMIFFLLFLAAVMIPSFV